MVHLVANELNALGVAPARDRGQFGRREHGSGRIRRAGDDDSTDGWIEGGEHLDRRLEPCLRSAFDLDDLAAQGRQDVAIAGIARARDRHPVPGVEAGQESEQETPGGSGGDHHVGGGHVEAVVRRVGVGDRGAQFLDAQCHGVPELIRLQRRCRCGQHRRGRAGTRLARRQVHQIAVAALALGGRQPHIHHMKRRDAGPASNLRRHRPENLIAPTTTSSKRLPTRADATDRGAARTTGRCCGPV